VKEVKDEQRNDYIQTTTEEKVIIESENQVEEIIITETIQERVEENSAVHGNEAESQNEPQNE